MKGPLSVMHFEHQYSVALYQLQTALQVIRSANKVPDIKQLSQLTGYSEEHILESMEFGTSSYLQHKSSFQ
ncbi:hypothetical protein Q9251_15615 [Alkalihalobacillus macyae]|uniref:hypothetical protein n=1 Tax=Guptibacillus hwajinpoensis TaxID=208199 RepID=UPI00273AE17B|nr:hypothetical protein [Alkalihalobacillus macyae]MDP4552305.1 hypothetical protein [Alkalihalobacillus macyae]